MIIMKMTTILVQKFFYKSYSIYVKTLEVYMFTSWTENDKKFSAKMCLLACVYKL